MVGWHHRLNGHKFEQTLGDGEGQGSLPCCSLMGQSQTRLRDWTPHTPTTTTQTENTNILVNWSPHVVIWGVQDAVPGLNVLSYLFQPTRCKKSKYSTVIVPKFSDSPDQILRKSCTASWQKPLKEPISPLPYEWEMALAPGKNSVKYSFGTTPPSRYQRPALQQDSWMTHFKSGLRL